MTACINQDSELCTHSVTPHSLLCGIGQTPYSVLFSTSDTCTLLFDVGLLCKLNSLIFTHHQFSDKRSYRSATATGSLSLRLQCERAKRDRWQAVPNMATFANQELNASEHWQVSTTSPGIKTRSVTSLGLHLRLSMNSLSPLRAILPSVLNSGATTDERELFDLLVVSRLALINLFYVNPQCEAERKELQSGTQTPSPHFRTSFTGIYQGKLLSMATS